MDKFGFDEEGAYADDAPRFVFNDDDKVGIVATTEPFETFEEFGFRDFADGCEDGEDVEDTAVVIA